MIRVATWLHPFLEALTEKVLRLKGHLEGLNRAVDENLIVASARGYAVEKPAPSQRMGQRAHLAIERAVVQSSSHVHSLLQALEDLRQRSSPDRLPQVVAGIGDACIQLDAVLSSSEFRACVGDRFPSLPRITDSPRFQNQIEARAPPPPSIMDVTEDDQDTILRTAATSQCDASEANLLGSSTPTSLFHISQNGASFRGQESGNDARHIAADTFRVHGKKGREQEEDLSKIFKEQLPRHVEQRASEDTFDALPLYANVFRLTAPYCGSGFRRHDRRALRLVGNQLDVFEKRSLVKVKTSVNVQRQVEECAFLNGSKRLSMTIRRLPPGAEIDSGVFCTKNYFFEFDSSNDAKQFHDEILRLSAS